MRSYSYLVDWRVGYTVCSIPPKSVDVQCKCKVKKSRTGNQVSCYMHLAGTYEHTYCSCTLKAGKATSSWLWCSFVAKMGCRIQHEQQRRPPCHRTELNERLQYNNHRELVHDNSIINICICIYNMQPSTNFNTVWPFFNSTGTCITLLSPQQFFVAKIFPPIKECSIIIYANVFNH